MKKIFFTSLVLYVVGSAYAQNKEYVTIQAEVSNRISDTLQIRTQEKVLKHMISDKNGIFKDTLKVADGFYFIFDGQGYSELYLKNGYNMKIKLDAQKFKESIVYSGKGENENNYLVQKTVAESIYDYKSLVALNEAEFDLRLQAKKAADLKDLESRKLDPEFVALQKKYTEISMVQITEYHKKLAGENAMNGKSSISFEYENRKGGKTKLEDFKGKYVYIDVWATWCGPCRTEIPYLKKIEEKYHDKKIEFVSISVDEDHDKWKTFVTEKQLGGVQLFADKNWNSDFIKSYNITGIPRFILIDPTGKIVKADAARPSNPDLQIELDSLLN